MSAEQQSQPEARQMTLLRLGEALAAVDVLSVELRQARARIAELEADKQKSGAE